MDGRTVRKMMGHGQGMYQCDIRISRGHTSRETKFAGARWSIGASEHFVC